MTTSISRHQRRHPGPAQDGPLNIDYGHTGQLLVMKFTRLTDHVTLTPRQADDMIAALQKVKVALADYLAAKQNG